MKPRQAVMAAPTRWEVWAGIDPGATSGLVAIRVPVAGPHAHDINQARLVAFGTASTSSSDKMTSAAARAQLGAKVRQWLHRHSVVAIVLEEPSTQTNSWKGAQEEGRATGSLFFLGAHYGLCLAAATTLPWETRVWGYPPTSPAKKKDKRERDTGEPVMGWMQGRNTVATKQSLTLHAMRALLTQLKQRPVDGHLPTREQLREVHVEHIYMGLGVLNFHLARERGAI